MPEKIESDTLAIFARIDGFFDQVPHSRKHLDSITPQLQRAGAVATKSSMRIAKVDVSGKVHPPNGPVYEHVPH